MCIIDDDDDGINVERSETVCVCCGYLNIMIMLTIMTKKDYKKTV